MICKKQEARELKRDKRNEMLATKKKALGERLPQQKEEEPPS
ncbi:hypothetical protein T11_16870 [Trichinella zimbabwensis]|uniref:Uncharacterized protein n=1 Tax=Trichinella zimbabwensis TaxID=268475 RepID=A0A0V1DRP1_9BILA|nr:hypothetical protein T11_16870 [Trichinella zimbabwensis]